MFGCQKRWREEILRVSVWVSNKSHDGKKKLWTFFREILSGLVTGFKNHGGGRELWAIEWVCVGVQKPW